MIKIGKVQIEFRLIIAGMIFLSTLYMLSVLDKEDPSVTIARIEADKIENLVDEEMEQTVSRVNGEDKIIWKKKDHYTIQYAKSGLEPWGQGSWRKPIPLEVQMADEDMEQKVVTVNGKETVIWVKNN